jgi:hypothetical protein
MKRCPECRRNYYDDSLVYCLDDGTPLVDGPASAEAPTPILPAENSPHEAVTISEVGSNRPTEILLSDQTKTTKGFSRRRLSVLALLGLTLVGAVLFFSYLAANRKGPEGGIANTATTPVVLYWQLTEPQQQHFIRERSRQVQTIIGDEPADFDEDAIKAIKAEIDQYVARKDSLSQKPFAEGLRAIYGRASQYAAVVIRAYEARRVPPALGLYQAMIESEYHDCPEPPFPNGPVGMFQFSRGTAAKYGLAPSDYCNVEKQSDAAARHMSDLASDFGDGKSNATLGLLAYLIGGDGVRDYLRQLRGKGVPERSFWALFKYQQNLQPPPTDEEKRYVPRFFAAAIIGEAPEVFELSTPPLTTLRPKGN